jgi:predicted nuclease of predicted toxin-antitoxin system
VRLLIDQDVYAVTTDLLRSCGHDIITARELGLSQAADTELLSTAHQDNRIFITRDRDFGYLVFLKSSALGVIYLRINPTTLQSTHTELMRVLNIHDEATLKSSFVVVEPARHRIRKLVTE